MRVLGNVFGTVAVAALQIGLILPMELEWRELFSGPVGDDVQSSVCNAEMQDIVDDWRGGHLHS